jgi:hypothetical protein
MSSVPPSPFPENQCLPKKLAAPQVLCRHSVLRTLLSVFQEKGIFLLTVLRIQEILARVHTPD